MSIFDITNKPQHLISNNNKIIVKGRLTLFKSYNDSLNYLYLSSNTKGIISIFKTLDLPTRRIIIIMIKIFI